MSFDTLVVHAADLARIRSILARLQADSGAPHVALIHRNGEAIAFVGESAAIDATSVASLTAGSAAAGGALARLLGDTGLRGLLLECEQRHLQLQVLQGGAILVVIFDERATLGLVRFRIRQAAAGLEPALAELLARGRGAGGSETRPFESFAGITEEDVDALFR